jgi:NADH:ubiquinone oxidoreductase subunit 5 (subunit L)/multisubunit Na+/H+ antiporter MnhA subunit
MLMAMVVIWNGYGTFTFSQIIASHIVTPLYIALPLIMIAAFTKSAQFPFHEWLADAMAGPTPVSAFLHSSTMVKAGVFVIMILLPLFQSTGMLSIILIIGIISAFIGATNALVETNIKKILAYSTIEDLGLILVALGLNSIPAAITLFIVQGFYKALLFMSAGVMIKANDDEEDSRKLTSIFSYKPLAIATIIAVLSIAGIFPLSGFFAKFGIESAANNFLVYALLLLIEFITSLYIFRWLFIPSKQKKTKNAEYSLSPKSMLIPIYVLAGFVAAATLVYLYSPSYISITGARFSFDMIKVLIETAIAVSGALASLAIYRTRGLDLRGGPAYKALHNSSITNEAYALIAKGFDKISEGIWAFDQALYYTVESGARGTMVLSNGIKNFANGTQSRYTLAFVVGAAVIILILVLL